MKGKEEKLEVRRGSDNIYHDFDHADGALCHLKCYLAAEIIRVLEDNGVLLLEFPNAYSLIDRGWDRPNHVSYFSPGYLKRQVESTGFRVTQVWAGCRYAGNPIPERLWLILSRIVSPLWGNIWIVGKKEPVERTPASRSIPFFDMSV